MSIRACLSALMLWAAVAPSLSVGVLAADEPAKIPADRVIGGVYGKSIKAGDVGWTAPIDVSKMFDSRDRELWDLMGRIQQTLGAPIMERFVKERKLEATADEVKRFREHSRKQDEKNVLEWEAKVAELTKQLAGPDLTAEKRAAIQKELDQYQQFLKSKREAGPKSNEIDGIARLFILGWKTERELHRVYGGRIIFQQFGPEALDARRKLFEEAETKGDLKFDDPGVRHLFYYYANMRHSEIKDDKALENPWFLGETK
jgi:hypothetical protein